MANKQRIYGGTLGIIGFLLSPLSWWNDLFINFPIAYVGACIVNLVYRGVFLSSFIVFYWGTNVLGFILMQKGIEKALKPGGKKKNYSLKDFGRDIALSLVYTFLIIVLVKKGIIRPFLNN